MVYLCDIEKGSKIRLDIQGGGTITVTFDHLDGMYSYCTVDGPDKSEPVHLSRFTPLNKGEDGVYEITNEKELQ